MWSEIASKLLTWHKQEEKELGIGVQQLTVILHNVYKTDETCYDGLETMALKNTQEVAELKIFTGSEQDVQD